MYPMRFIQPSPLLRTGLAVSGANCGTVVKPGYLMGYELASEDLTNCQLMVLSACETALGDIESHLGVAGIQRMLKLAGVQFILATLWKIPDAATAIFMEQFYKNLMQLKDPQEALTTTQKLLCKKMPVSDWGAFVLIK
jgi:CHAT domain-containing protein